MPELQQVELPLYLFIFISLPSPCFRFPCNFDFKNPKIQLTANHPQIDRIPAAAPEHFRATVHRDLAPDDSEVTQREPGTSDRNG